MRLPDYKFRFSLFVLTILGLFPFACTNSTTPSTPASVSNPAPTLSPTSTPTATPTITSTLVFHVNLVDAVDGGGVTVSDYSLPITYQVSVCNADAPIGSPVTIVDSISGSDFQLQAWGWNGVMPYTYNSLDASGNPFVVITGTSGKAVFPPGLPNGCVTILAAYQNINWPNSACQSFTHSTHLALPSGQSRDTQSSPLVVPCVSPPPSFTPTETVTFTVTPTPTDTPTETVTPTITNTPS